MEFLAIIGGGPAGYTAAELARKAGKSVLLFEENALGGTCLNVGCIPTKTLLYSAKQYYYATHGDKYGIAVENASFDYKKMLLRKQKIVRKLQAGIRQKVGEYIQGRVESVALVEGGYQLTCAGQTYEAENLLICTGSHNFVPPIPGLKDNPAVWDSTDALSADTLPQSIAIIGGGVIGMEFATLYHELGVEVTVIEALPTILPNIDADIVKMLTDKYTKMGIRILTDSLVESVDGTCLTRKSPVSHPQVAGDSDEGRQTLTADRILVSVGRRPNLDGLEGLTGLELYKGGIVVDEFGKTNLPGVYAAGDVTGKMMLAHVASRQAEVAVGRMLKQLPLQRIAMNAIPSVVYTNPEIATVGLTEQQVCAFYMEMEGKSAEEVAGMYVVKTLPMAFSGRFVAENEGENGLCKVIYDSKNRTILGVHCIGNSSSEFIAAASFAVRMGYTVEEFRQVVFPHPTVSEIIRETIL